MTSHDCTQRLTPRQLAIVRLLEVRLELGAVRGNHLLPRAAHVCNLGVERAARFAHSRRQCFEQGRDLGSTLLHEVCNPGRCLGADALEQARLRGDLLRGTAQLAASRLDLRHGIVERRRNLAHRILPQLACLVSNRLCRLLTRLGLVAFALLDRRQAVELIRQELGAKSGDALLLLELRTLFGQHANLVVGDELVAQGGPFAVCRMRGRTLELVVDELLSLVQEQQRRKVAGNVVANRDLLDKVLDADRVDAEHASLVHHLLAVHQANQATRFASELLLRRRHWRHEQTRLERLGRRDAELERRRMVVAVARQRATDEASRLAERPPSGRQAPIRHRDEALVDQQLRQVAIVTHDRSNVGDDKLLIKATHDSCSIGAHAFKVSRSLVGNRSESSIIHMFYFNPSIND